MNSKLSLVCLVLFLSTHAHARTHSCAHSHPRAHTFLLAFCSG